MFCHLHWLKNWLDLLAGHDNRLRCQGNAAYGSEDACAQATCLVLMRALVHKFTDWYLLDDPFAMQLTDMHTNNIFVTLSILNEHEDINMSLSHNEGLNSQATIMKSSSENGGYWYSKVLQTPKGMFNLFRSHLETFYDEVAEESLFAAISPFWISGMTSFVNSKLEKYILVPSGCSRYLQ
ncbi:hypothetical protein ACJ72_03913 [Emergomyces africanus]|uniref:Uncharacterized protein n=1 Tax=Emergomyces africanus TaxID=1955775 RepID=A0A1B7NYC3_9EURO|nr:hypothetical protein ACJ72_03913 [Emergomyces africanus]